MNYNMQGMQKTIPELFAMLKAAEVEIKKEHQVLMVNKTTSFKKKGKGKKGNFKKNSKSVATSTKKPKSGAKPETECFYCKGTGHWKRNCPKYLADKKDGKALYLHCLPADITGLSCAEGEVDNSVFDRYIVPLYKQASYKPYIIAAMIFLAQVKDPVRALMAMDEGKEQRKSF